MTDISGNHRLDCTLCSKKNILVRDYSNHLNKEHLSEIFIDVKNKKELEELASKKTGKYFRPVELKVKDKEMYFVPCCKKYYSKIAQAEKHNKNKECCEKVLEESKSILEQVQHITINNNIDISGNNNTIPITNNITNNYNFYDLSGNLIKKITKELCSTIDDERYNKVCYYKKLQKLRQIFKDHPDYDSDYSSISSAYDSDDEKDCDDYLNVYRHYDITKETYDKDIKKAKVDLSRSNIGLSTKEDKLEKKKQKEEEERFQKELEEAERSEKIGNLRADIIAIKNNIKYYQKLHNENINLWKEENSGITEEIFKKDFCQQSKLDKLKKDLELTQKVLLKLLNQEEH